MQFRTELPGGASKFAIAHQDKLMLSGSCFTSHIGQRLAALKFDTMLNPYGVVYNPISISKGLERLNAASKPFRQDELFVHDGLWHSWEHHGDFSQPDPQQALEKINAAYSAAAHFLKNSTRLLLTLGTAEVFEHVESKAVVANNHKVPAAAFSGRRLSVQEVVDVFVPLLGRLRGQNAAFQVILTVSPVRHLRSGLVENQRSKAVLILACAQICQELDYVEYFPAYELLQDDLRDYRFYEADLIHPSQMAIDYIWTYFSNAFFSDKTRELNKNILKITAAAQHRPFHPNTAAYQAFVQQQMSAIELLQKENPGLDFEAEKNIFRQRANR